MERRFEDTQQVAGRAVFRRSSASRFVNSLVLTPWAEGEEPRISLDELREFIATGSTVLG